MYVDRCMSLVSEQKEKNEANVLIEMGGANHRASVNYCYHLHFWG
jgi:hypothetical protein